MMDIEPDEHPRFTQLKHENRNLQNKLKYAKRKLKAQDEASQAMLLMLEDVNQLQADLESAKQHWEATFDAISDPVFLHDDKGRIVRANRAYALIAKIPLQEVVGKFYWQCFPLRDGPLPGCCLTTKGDAGDVVIAFEDITSGCSFLSRSYRVHDAFNHAHYGVHVIQDVTAQQRSHRQLEERGDELRQALEGSVRAIASAVEMRDPYTAGHQRRVGRLGRAIGSKMKFEVGMLEGIYFGGIIHDIGKIHVPAEILAWPGRLSALQYALVQEHPDVGHQILRDIHFPWPVAAIAHQHHERLDGSGYPQGLTQDESCLEAQVIAVADVVESMSSHRPYRPGLGIDKALAEVERGRSTLYNADVVDACVELFRRDGFVLSAP